ncbi:MAG: succinate dehydrogenase assembly factor 2 [Mesorhizobium sp.]
MTGTTISSADLDPRRRKALLRAWRRGTREMDLILGGFADAHLATLSEVEMDEFERIMAEADPSLYKWISGELPVPSEFDTPFFARIVEHKRHGLF